MKVYGALEAAQIEWFTNAGKPAASSYPFRVIYVTDLKQIQVSDGTNWNPSALYTYTAGTLPAAGASNQYQVAFITDTLQVKVSNGTEWKTIGARLDTYTSGTIPAAASNTNSIIWVSDLQQVQVSNGSAWVQVGSKAGTKNYFTQNNANPDFETNSVSPWSACTLTFSGGVPSGAPTLTATQMAISTTSTTPLAGTYSMLLTKSAANAQYQGFISGALTIDREDTSKVLYGSFYYEVVSGTIDLSGSSTQDLEIWIYNTVSGQWTQPAGYRGMNQSSGVGKVVFSFQTDGTYANNAYRIAVITQQTSTSSYVVEFDDFQVGPQAIVLGSAMTDWQSYTPTFTGLGTATAVGFTYRRVGDSVEIQGKFTVGTATATEARISLPSGLTASDTTKIPSLSKVGSFTASYIEAFAGEVLAEPSVAYITLGKQGSGTPGLQKLNGNSVFSSSGQICSLFARIPIQGFGSFSQMSSDTDTRVIVANCAVNTGTSVTAATPINFDSVITDNTGSVSPGTGTWKFTAPVSGFYEVSTSFATGTSNNVFQIFKNNSVYRQIGYTVGSAGSNFTSSGSTIVQLNAGDYIDIRPNNTQTLTVGLGTGGTVSTANWISINRLSGPSVITATETVAASYWASANGTSSATAPFNFDAKEYDTHNAVTTGASWKFTAPVSGVYSVSFYTNQNSPGNAVYYKLYKNSTTTSYKPLGYCPATVGLVTSTTSLRLNAGDYIGVYSHISQNYLGNTSLNSDYISHISINRIGN